MNIVLIGKPGSGKGTAADQIAKDYGNKKKIVAGDLLRAERASGSELGKEIQSLIDKGNLVPDEMINNIIEQELGKPISLGTFYLLDGYPRTINQAIALDAMLNISVVIYFDVDDSTILKRIEERGKESGRADDQDTEITKQRLENYYKDTAPVVDYYDQHSILYRVDASKSVDEVYTQIKSILDENS
jgi:adenylate kinase